ncbi:putative membrane protein [Acetobacter nitrogenifigens DSM 23921 = NBRC 105050]|uniref:Cytochrome c oxidase assembly protein n=1 Tax=Acetobacter nitrogenifigens DSM 23921 = NBRC 105050 TaxID=1120919 RepID=A0A511X9I1_9PROT|nr:cytochrome c oxidase assembly protein [Acetobacter nitrogenifigens]GBQ93565.1 putative membrane protein [Acetobacter nitrogenifigens DSM 23921 = NBRC 105050]GEN59607.1 hypothetical protein ANI02nite_14910 [Acetobacter nitrogenifigens DSM 23921 = NBRC 105050]
MREWTTGVALVWTATAIMAACAVLWAGRSRRRGLARSVAGVLGCGLWIAAEWGLHDPLASMTQYTAGLMVMGQVVPPFLLLAMPAGGFMLNRGGWLRDPMVALVLFAGLGVATGLPSVLDRSLANALFSAPLALLGMFTGLLFWAQILPGVRVLKSDFLVGVLVLVGSLPMTVIAVIWMVSSHVLYAPYLDVLCRWDLTPLQDQRWAGFVMLLAGMPLQIVGLCSLLLGGGQHEGQASWMASGKPERGA